MIKKVYLILSLLLLSVLSYAQDFTKTKHTIKADEAFNINELMKALSLYKKAYKKAQSKAEKAYITFQRAEIQRLTNNTKKAIARYKSAITKGYPDPKAHLYYANMLRANMLYEEAVKEYDIYLQKVPNDSVGIRGKLSCELSDKWIKHPTRYQIDIMKAINSRASDFTANYSSFDGTEIIFTSSRKKKGPKKINKRTGELYTNLFEIIEDRTGKWSKAKPLTDTINSPFDDGAPSFTADYNTMYFMRCNWVKDKDLGCQIYVGRRQKGEYFASAERLAIVPDSISVGQPSISEDEKILYFASDMPGGYGGTDIWKVENKGGEWSEPINLGPKINTIGNEYFPYIRENGILYFSSDYLPGMGGLDIFRAVPKGDTWEVFNMKFPINSSADDFAITFKRGTEEGMFSSSRKITEIPQADGKLITIKARGKDDVYHFILPVMEFTLTGIVKDMTNEKTISKAIVEIYGDDGSEMTIKTGIEGRFKYRLKKDVDYIFIVKRKGYLNSKGTVSTMDLDDTKHFVQTITMAKIGDPIKLENTFYDFGKWTLTEASKKELEKLVKILNDNPNITIELGAHTDMIGNENSNQILSQKRAQSVVDFLISKGIKKDRLTAKGYGESVPQKVTAQIAAHSHFKEGDVLSPEFIEKLQGEDEEKTKALQEEANQINRRTEFRITSTRYIPDIDD